MRTYLQDLKAQLAACMADLAGMPSVGIGRDEYHFIGPLGAT
jgi:hypothetical protein